jgi:non-ribosomal peptide synthetase component F
VPLDPTFPADRLSIYLEDSQAAAVISEQHHLELAASLIADLPLRPEVGAQWLCSYEWPCGVMPCQYCIINSTNVAQQWVYMPR